MSLIGDVQKKVESLENQMGILQDTMIQLNQRVLESTKIGREPSETADNVPIQNTHKIAVLEGSVKTEIDRIDSILADLKLGVEMARQETEKIKEQVCKQDVKSSDPNPASKRKYAKRKTTSKKVD